MTHDSIFINPKFSAPGTHEYKVNFIAPREMGVNAFFEQYCKVKGLNFEKARMEQSLNKGEQFFVPSYTKPANYQFAAHPCNSHKTRVELDFLKEKGKASSSTVSLRSTFDQKYGGAIDVTLRILEKNFPAVKHISQELIQTENPVLLEYGHMMKDLLDFCNKSRKGHLKQAYRY